MSITEEVEWLYNSDVVKKLISFFDKKAFKLLIVWLLLLATLYSMLSIVRHNTFLSGGFDLGIFDQALWQYSNFLYPYNTIRERLILSDHLTLTLPLLSPLYWVWSDVRALLIFQAVWVCASVVAVYKLCILRKLQPFAALCISVMYSLFYGTQFMVYFDFHPVAIGVGLLPWIAYFLEAKKQKLLIVSICLLLLTQENMGIALASLGFIYVFKREYRKAGLLFIISGILASLLLLKITGLLSPIGYDYSPAIQVNPAQNIIDLFNAEEKRLVWFYSFSWFSFLPLLSPGAILGVTFDLAQYFVTGPEFSRMWSPYMHHRAILGILLTLGTIDAILLLRRRFKVSLYILSCILLLSVVFQQYYFHFPLNKLAKKVYWQDQSWMADNRSIMQNIPQDAGVATQQNLVPHLSQRKEIYLVWPRRTSKEFCGTDGCWWLFFSGKPEYLTVNLDGRQTLTQLLETPARFTEAVRNMEKEGKIRLEKSQGSARLYKVAY